MRSVERPRLRGDLVVQRDYRDPQRVIIWDRLRLSDAPRLSSREYGWMLLLDGQRTLREVQAEAISQSGGELLPLELFAELVKKLEDALYLDGPRFRKLMGSPVREPTCVAPRGCYASQPEALRRQLAALFTDRQGPGLPDTNRKNGRLRAALIPHIDYYRGGPTYAWGFKEVAEQADASLFVIIGTSHFSLERFTLTRKDFKTPLGVVRADQDYIDRLVRHYGDGLFDDELAHLPEHSIELEVVFLQYLYEGRRPIRIVPLVVGSFHDAVAEGGLPSEKEEVGRMVEALRRAEDETAEPICYIISGDLAHIGPKFDDPEPVSAAFIRQSKKQDQAILKQAEAADPAGYFRVIAAEKDRRRICGLPPTYTFLEALRPGRGKLLHYDQYVHPLGYESVSFASVAFYR